MLDSSSRGAYRTPRPNVQPSANLTGPERHTCGVWSRQAMCSPPVRLVRAGRPGVWARRSGRRCSRRRRRGNLVGQGLLS
jgi:hypothetical protein